MHKIRLQVFLSRQGLCSRRDAMDWVKAGRVALNGTINREPSTPVDPHSDRISVDGKEIKPKQLIYIMLNKPRGCMTTRFDPHAPKIIYDYLPKEFKTLVPVGRLDLDTEGLLILTNDGDLAFKLTHPKFHLDKVYSVRVFGKLEANEIKMLEAGVVIEKKKTLPAKIEHVSLSKGQTQFDITIQEGRKRQIRLMLKRVGKTVIYLKRIAQGPIAIGDLKPGQWRELNLSEVGSLKGL